jgi:hypothetical protein
MKRFACVLVFLLFATSAAYAQGVGSSGDIVGTVRDPSGAVLPKVAITVADGQTGFKREVTTDATGQYRVVGLPPSTYDVSAQLSGFATEIRKGVMVQVGQTISADFQLQVSQVATEIEVTGLPPCWKPREAARPIALANDTSRAYPSTAAIILRLRC